MTPASLPPELRDPNKCDLRTEAEFIIAAARQRHGGPLPVAQLKSLHAMITYALASIAPTAAILSLAYTNSSSSGFSPIASNGSARPVMRSLTLGPAQKQSGITNASTGLDGLSGPTPVAGSPPSAPFGQQALHQHLIPPAFVELDMAPEGFGCLFLPSIAPQGPFSIYHLASAGSMVSAGPSQTVDNNAAGGIGSGWFTSIISRKS
ncbi:unnamed protein product [Protopolystoma xenopodis]|uniref:Uncharacterized protein n=1 Tax=Protopolystoma xenopodis TaxID=117903 RepID=A0A448WAA9_9PLAT|nr:unnamed protein product [Protopolystoma xenopodis]